MMPFWLAMAGRELRSAWRHFVYFLACIALGVGAVVGVSLFSVNVEQAVLKEARGLLGGDLEVRVSRPLGTSGTDLLRGLESRGGTQNQSERARCDGLNWTAVAGRHGSHQSTRGVEGRGTELSVVWCFKVGSRPTSRRASPPRCRGLSGSLSWSRRPASAVNSLRAGYWGSN